MTLRYLLDSNVLSVPVMKRADAHVIARLEQHRAQCAIPTPVWHELVYGWQRLPPSKRRTDLELYLERHVRGWFAQLPYDQEAATWHAVERARLEAIGRPTPFIDGQIAAIARTNGLILVTANTKDFAHFADVDVVDWSKPKTKRS